MSNWRSTACLTFVVSAVFMAPGAHATNGYFLPGFGIRSQGMGGVGVAVAGDALSQAANPANLVGLGMRGDLGVTIFNPVRHAKVVDRAAGGAGDFGFSGDVESDAEWFPMPEMAFSMPLDSQWTVGVAMVGAGGMNTTYRKNLFAAPEGHFTNALIDAVLGAGKHASVNSDLGVDLMQLLVPLSAAFKVNEQHALGASLVLAAQRFRAYGLENFANFTNIPAFQTPITSDTATLTHNQFDWSFGAGVKVGWQGDFLDDRLTLGATYASRTYMTKFNLYKGLFAEQGGFDIPSNYGIGLALRPTKGWMLAFDVNRIRFSEIASVGNRGPDQHNGLGGIPTSSAYPDGDGVTNTNVLTGKDLGMGFGWNDITVYKFGISHDLNDKWTVRAGYNYGKSPIVDDQLTFNILAPATTERHYSIGFTYRSKESPLEITGTYMYAAAREQSSCGNNILDCVSIGMHQNFLGVSASWVLDPPSRHP